MDSARIASLLMVECISKKREGSTARVNARQGSTCRDDNGMSDRGPWRTSNLGILAVYKKMYGPAACRNENLQCASEVADLYPACLFDAKSWP